MTTVPALDGVFNLRDLGGLAVPGGTTRLGRLYRADGLHRLSEAHRPGVAQLGISMVVDLRDDDEAARDGRFSHDGIEVRSAPIADIPKQLVGETRGDDLLRHHLVAITENAGPQLSQALADVAEALAAERSVVFHCFAGKDRTGVLAALILSGIGASDDVVTVDFARSAEPMVAMAAWLAEAYGITAADKMAEFGLAPEMADVLFSARPATMAGLLADLADAHGSVAGYIDTIGATDAIATIRHSLVT
ncbi:MAG: tyrosine-protein phosphatase [Acidimicrobiales bacterium]